MIGVACDEWRNGFRIGTVCRYYGYTFDDCNRPVAADIRRDPLATALGDFTTLVSQCNGDPTVRFANNSRGALRYHWDFGDPGRTDDTSAAEYPSYTYPGPGTYPVKLVVYGGSCNDSLTGNVVIGAAVPAPEFRIDGGRCVLDSLYLTDETGPGSVPVRRYFWATENGLLSGPSAVASYLSSGSKSILHVIQMEDGCYGGLEKQTEILSAPVDAGSDTTLIAGSTLQLHATGAVRYTWIPFSGRNTTLDQYNIADPVLTAFSSGTNNTYVLIGTDANGCRGLDTLKVTVASQGYAFVPGAFSPNGDGKNDVLRCYLAGQRLISFSVYDRSGARVFTTSDINTGWDGRYNGAEAAMTTYYWMIEGVNPGGRAVFKGDVFLMR